MAASRSISSAVLTCSTCTRRAARRARRNSRLVARIATSSSRHTGCIDGSAPSRTSARRSRKRGSSSEWIATRRRPWRSTASKLSSSATSSEPVEEPMKTFTPAHPGSSSSLPSSAAFSSDAPMKNAWSTQARPAARRSLSFSAASSTVLGLVLGISKKAVTPPIAAPAEPVARSSLWSSPGSRKCTWVSITPGRTVRPAALNRSAAAAEARAPRAAIRPPLTPMSQDSRPFGVATWPPVRIRSKLSGIRAADDPVRPRKSPENEGEPPLFRGPGPAVQDRPFARSKP